MNLIQLQIDERFLKELKKSGKLNEFITYHRILINTFLDSLSNFDFIEPLENLFDFTNGNISGIKN
jgi:hypothetical protein